MMEITFNAFYTLIAAVIVLLLGRFLVNNINFLKKYNIPEPVAGGLVAAVASLIVHNLWGYSITTSSVLQTSFMLIFFASIGLSANFAKLKEGGMGLGLYFSDLVMNMIGGKLLFPDSSDLEIPDVYNGACIALVFPN